VDGDGDFVVAWDAYESRSVLARAYTAGSAPQGDPFVIHSHGSDSPDNPAVALDEDGELVAAFEANEFGSSEDVPDVYARRFGGVGSPVEPPRVAQVFLASGGWTDTFKYYLQYYHDVGDRHAGFAVPGGPDQLEVLPWAGLDRVSVRFSRSVIVGQDDLVVRGVKGGDYPAAAFAYDRPTRTATWTLARPVGPDRVTLDLRSGPGGVAAAAAGEPPLDGEWAGPSDNFPSGDGAPGGDFRLALNVLPGDVNRDGRVTALDLARIRARRTLGTGSPGYTPFDDPGGDDRISDLDLLLARRNLYRRLPPAPLR
jgi:hypothetical protein